MWIVGSVTVVTLLAPGLGAGAAEPTADTGGLDRSLSYVQAQEVREPRIWLDRGVDPVLEAGDRVRIYYRTDADAYVAILQIDTDGTTRMLYPRSPTENHYARADREYRLLFPRSAYWNVDDRPGVGYFFIVTSPIPFDLSQFRYSYYDGGWDLSTVGSTVYTDPYVAMDDYVAQLVPDWQFVDYGLDFISYSVGGQHEYPRFLCYQCHGFRPYGTWNPYRYTCVNFRVVLYDDPYFYPSYRYRADRVVMVGPRNPTRPRFGFKERAVGEAGTPVTVVRQGRRTEPAPTAVRPSTGQGAGRGRVASPPVVPRPTEARRPTETRRPTEARRPTETRRPDVAGRADAPRVRTGAGRVSPPPAGDRAPRRPTLERRSADPSQSTRPPSQTTRPRSTQPRPSPRPSTRRPPAPSGGSSSARPAPRARSGTPPADRGATRSAPRRSTNTRAR